MCEFILCVWSSIAPESQRVRDASSFIFMVKPCFCGNGEGEYKPTLHLLALIKLGFIAFSVMKPQSEKKQYLYNDSVFYLEMLKIKNEQQRGKVMHRRRGGQLAKVNNIIKCYSQSEVQRKGGPLYSFFSKYEQQQISLIGIIILLLFNTNNNYIYM